MGQPTHLYDFQVLRCWRAAQKRQSRGRDPRVPSSENLRRAVLRLGLQFAEPRIERLIEILLRRRAQQPRSVYPLICLECGRVSAEGRGWKAEWADPDDDFHELTVYCPACWKREFGPTRYDGTRGSRPGD